MSIPEVKILKDYKRFQIGEVNFNLPGIKETICHYICVCPKVSAILAITEQGKVVLVKQFRPIVGKDTIEIPAGCIEKDETSLEAAKRELREETGYEVLNIQLIKNYRPSSGYSNEEISLYFATVTNKTEQCLDTTEKIQILEVDIKEAFEMLELGQLEGSSTDIALRWYVGRFGLPR